MANSSRQYVLKFSIPDSKKALVVDCGNKVHLSEFDRPIAPAPSNFVTKLRKHLKTRRLSLIKQIKNDRVLVLQFSDGLFYLVLEFFSAGNVLLLDHDRKILALQRLVNDLGPENGRYAVNEVYNSFDTTLFTDDECYEASTYSQTQIREWLSVHKEKLLKDTLEKKKKKVFSIHKLLFISASHLSSDLILKCLVENGVDPSRICTDLEEDEDLANKTVDALTDAEVRYVDLIEKAREGNSKGWIISKRNALYNPEDEQSLEYIFDEFHPFEPFKENKSNLKFESFDGYNKTLDKFFSTIESTKYTLKVEQQKQNALKRLEHARSEREKQIELLITQQEINERKGNTITYHAHVVEECKEYVQDMIKKQMDWTDIENIIKFDASRGKAVAQFIKLPLNLLEGTIKLSLPDVDQMLQDDDPNSTSDLGYSDTESNSTSESESESDTSDSESETDSETDSDSETEEIKRKKHKKKTGVKKRTNAMPTLTVDIDLALSAFANASVYFESKKVAVTKQTRVEKNTKIALKNAERKIQSDLNKNLKNETESLRAFRHKFWFEKYFWFTTSDGYLCLAGRDDLQTDMIYYRHFSDGDYFVSSDLDGAAKVFILNPYKAQNVSPSALFQAGIFALLTSTAWSAKISSSAWWMSGADVTKREFDGSLLGPGILKYKAKKNYMPPAQMVMGFGFYWLCDEETTQKYKIAREKRQEEHGLKVSFSNKKLDLDDMSIKSSMNSTKEEASLGETQKEPENSDEPSRKDAYSPIEDTEASHPEEKETETMVESVEKQLANLRAKSSSPSPSLSNKQKNVRGKKGKLKKINAKYADQDEEERRLRMEMLGTLKQIEELERKRREAEKAKSDQQQNEKHGNKAASKQQKAEERELQRYLKGEMDEDNAIGTNYLELLDSLVAKPARDDIVADLVPVFAPWASMAKFKYKVKIQPGLGKKGKSLSDALAYFSHRKVDASRTDTDVDWPNEHEILSSTKSNDIIGALAVNKMKLVLPGGNQSDAKGKKAKRGGKN